MQSCLFHICISIHQNNYCQMLNSIEIKDEKARVKRNSILEYLNKDISFSLKKLPFKKKEQIFSGLSIMLNAGMELSPAISILLSENNDRQIKAFLTELNKNLISGIQFSDTINSTGYFSDYEVYSVKVGEESGRLGQVFDELNKYYNRKIEQRRKMISSFSYPVLVIFTAILVVVFMLNFIVPMFYDVFQRFGSDLPAITNFTIKLSEITSKYFLLFIVLLAAFVVSVLIYRDKIWFQKSYSWVVLKIPLFGKLLLNNYKAQLCQFSSLMLKSGIPLTNTINMLQNVITFYPVHTALKDVEMDLIRGETVYDSFRKHSCFDARFTALIKVGEEVNKLDEIFERMQTIYSEEFKHNSTVISQLMEPILIFTVGIFVAFILISMYLPIFKLSTNFI